MEGDNLTHERLLTLLKESNVRRCKAIAYIKEWIKVEDGKPVFRGSIVTILKQLEGLE